MTDQTPVTPDGDAAHLLTQIGDRVRRAREALGLPRRALSETSGVSPRYLAQLETGAGNVSITVLHRVAQALGLTVDTLVSPDPAAQRVAHLFQSADPETQTAVMRMLAAKTPPGKAQRLCLIGLRGAGKSTLGAMASTALNMPFVELNREIEARGCMPVGEIMALYGPDGYRQLEAEALAQVADTHDRVVLAVAGGIVSDRQTYATLRARFHTLWLRAAPQDHMDRVRAQGDTRPMAGRPEAMTQLQALLTAREPLYALADMQLTTSGATPAQSLDALVALVSARGLGPALT